MEDDQEPLTDKQIRQFLFDQIEQTMHARLEVAALQQLLVEAKILTEEQIVEVRLQSRQKTKEALARVSSAMSLKPPRSVQ